MELSEEGKAEIAAAIKILRDDGVHIHKTYAQFMKSQSEPKNNADPGKSEPSKTDDGTNPPPAKTDNADPPNPEPKKRDLWWGDRE